MDEAWRPCGFYPAGTLNEHKCSVEHKIVENPIRPSEDKLTSSGSQEEQINKVTTISDKVETIEIPSNEENEIQMKKLKIHFKTQTKYPFLLYPHQKNGNNIKSLTSHINRGATFV